MSKVEGKMSRVQKCRHFFILIKNKQTEQNKTKQNKKHWKKENKFKKNVTPATRLEPPSFWITMRALYHYATKPTLIYRDRVSLLNPLRVTSRIFQEGACFFEHEVKSTRLYFTPKRFHPQTNSTWLGSRHHPSSIGFFGLKPHSSSPPTQTTIFSKKKFFPVHKVLVHDLSSLQQFIYWWSFMV